MSNGEPAAKKAKLGEVAAPLVDEEVSKRLASIDRVQLELDGLNEKASDEILKIEQKFNSLRQPHYEKRTQLIKEIPNFWPTTFLNHPQIADIVDDDEIELLKSLISFEVEESEDIKRGYKLKFLFSPNDYFENDKIEKEFVLDEATTATTTPIKWKEGKNLSKQDGDNCNIALSFFEWLSDSGEAAGDEIAEILKDDIWTNPVQYFLSPEMEDVGDDLAELVDDEEALEEVDDDGSENGDA